MRTTDLFKNNRSSKRLNESLSKTFGTKLDLESFDTPKLEDARNKLRTQIHTARQESGFNETIENETLTQAQFMHDAIVAELMDRQEHIVDTSVQTEGGMDELAAELGQIANDEDYDKLYDLLSDDGPMGKYLQSQIEDITAETGLHPKDDFEEIEQRLMDRIQQEFGDGSGYDGDREDPNGYDDEGGETDDNYALASAGFGSDEDYESINNEGESQHTDMSIAQDVYAENPDLDSEDDILKAAFPHVVKMMGGNKKRANYLFNYDEDFPGEMIGAYKWLQRQEHDVGEATGRDAYQRDYDSSVSGMGRRERENDEGNTEPANNFAVSINGKQWKVFKGRGYYADDDREKQHYRQLKDWAAKKSESTGKKWTVSITGENPTESIDQKEDMNTNEAYINNARDAINLLADIRKQSKMAELGQGDPVRPNQLVNDLYDVMQWIEANMKESFNTESVNTGDIMTRLQEGEVQQASAIVTAKTMVDRVSRWIEELSSMENDTLLQLGDSIRDEMGQEQAKSFISSVAPAIQQALENLKSTRETMATGVRQLTGEEQGAEMLGGEPDEMGGDEMGPAEPDAMNMGDEMGGEDEFAAAEPAAGGLGDAGRAQRESIDRSNSLLKVLAG
jgi:hypothetical protein